MNCTLTVLNLAIFTIFDYFCKILYLQKVSNPQNRKIKYLMSLRFSFPNTWSKFYADNGISQTFTYSNKIRVSETYLITATLINNRKIDIQWDFHYLLNTREIFCNHQITKLNTCKMFFFPIANLSTWKI